MAILGMAFALTVNGSLAEAESRGQVDFGAYYTRLPVAGNDMDKVGDYADIVVRVGTNKTFIFARDSSYSPCLVVGGQKTYVEELVERKGVWNVRAAGQDQQIILRALDREHPGKGGCTLALYLGLQPCAVGRGG